jgi:flagellin
MIINHNISALNTYRQLSINNTNLSKSLEKLSSGLRINRAGDDAAGLAISEKMRAQISGLDQASRNAQDGISLIQTAEGALNETHSILQRMRELAVQAANDTNTDQDRQNIQSEMTQLEKEIDRIANTTQFNTKNVLDGSMGGPVNGNVANVNANSVLESSTGAALQSTTLLVGLEDSNGNSLGIQVGDNVTINYVKGGTTYTVSVSVASTTDIASVAAQLDGFNGDTSTVVSNGSLVVSAATAGTQGAVYGLTITVKDSSGNVRQAATNALSSFTETKAAADAKADGRATLMIGANTGQTVQVDISDMRATALGVNGLQVTTQAQANIAVKVIDNAIQKVSAQRGTLGALQNRLEHTINNLGTSSENLSAAESRIRDVDMAKEMMNYTKNNILTQAAQAMLAQANQVPQGVLQLLRG